jgi:hypothetical protein
LQHLCTVEMKQRVQVQKQEQVQISNIRFFKLLQFLKSVFQKESIFNNYKHLNFTSHEMSIFLRLKLKKMRIT